MEGNISLLFILGVLYEGGLGPVQKKKKSGTREKSSQKNKSGTRKKNAKKKKKHMTILLINQSTLL